MARISPHFPRLHGIARVDDPRVISGILYVIRNELPWKDAPAQAAHRESNAMERYAAFTPNIKPGDVLQFGNTNIRFTCNKA